MPTGILVIFPYLNRIHHLDTRLQKLNALTARKGKWPRVRMSQGGITCGTIDEPRKSSKAIDERVIIDFCDKNDVISRFRDKNGGFLFYR